MTDDDKQFVEEIESVIAGESRYFYTDEAKHLCRIIRELEEKVFQLKQTDHHTTDQLVKFVRELDTLKAEIENAPWLFSGPKKGLGGVTEEWSRAEFDGEDTHRAKRVRIEEIKR